MYVRYDGATVTSWKPETLESDEWRRFYRLEPFMRMLRPIAPGESREHVAKISVRSF